MLQRGQVEIVTADGDQATFGGVRMQTGGLTEQLYNLGCRLHILSRGFKEDHQVIRI